eukprot:697569-Pleurochrysis_carterae.AAC.1
MEEYFGVHSGWAGDAAARMQGSNKTAQSKQEVDEKQKADQIGLRSEDRSTAKPNLLAMLLSAALQDFEPMRMQTRIAYLAHVLIELAAPLPRQLWMEGRDHRCKLVHGEDAVVIDVVAIKKRRQLVHALRVVHLHATYVLARRMHARRNLASGMMVYDTLNQPSLATLN